MKRAIVLLFLLLCLSAVPSIAGHYPDIEKKYPADSYLIGIGEVTTIIAEGSAVLGDKVSAVEAPIFQNNDEIVIRVTANEPSFINLFSVDQYGRVMKLYPNDLIKPETIPAGKEFLFPEKPLRVCHKITYTFMHLIFRPSLCAPQSQPLSVDSTTPSGLLNRSHSNL
ncbi:MAG: DUF4384 domain-containing protein, partial [Nitrospirae bacterium]|nr:DUF4384 domain-containing protein [Nitrospirota bacterium]